jgi:hypothetical protein
MMKTAKAGDVTTCSYSDDVTTCSGDDVTSDDVDTCLW